MITGKTESIIVRKYLSYECKCKFDGREGKSHQKWDSNKCRCKSKKYHTSEKNIFGILLHVLAKMGNT